MKPFDEIVADAARCVASRTLSNGPTLPGFEPARQRQAEADELRRYVGARARAIIEGEPEEKHA